MMNPSWDPKVIRTYVAVVEHGSMAAAAAELGYVASAVTQQIKGLEGQLGTQLLVRKPGSRIALTAAGRAVHAAAKPLLQAHAEFGDVTRAVGQLDAPTLILGTYATAIQYLLPQVLDALRLEGLLPTLSMREMETPDALPLIHSGALDMLLGYRYLKTDDPRPSEALSTRVVARESMLVVACSAERRSFVDCQASDWSIGDRTLGDRRLLLQWAEGQGFDPRISFETSDPNCSMTLVSSGLAVSLLPATVVRAGLQRGERISIIDVPRSQELYREIFVATRPTFEPAVLYQFLDLLQEAASDANDFSAESLREPIGL
ncbi:LysR family transcriptional regulator [Microbacterium sp. Se63.02b]|nr:LysR family transcriptional regulator [Microbacterium sp. Se63.02b]QYM63134.1 LysR family transcriptional regulator [Microbacterium sp. Se5.02b]